MKHLFTIIIFLTIVSNSIGQEITVDTTVVDEMVVDTNVTEDELNQYIVIENAFEKYKKLKSPIAFSLAYITHNDDDIPIANIQFFSITEKIIDALTVLVYCYDNFNRPVKHPLKHTNYFESLYQREIEFRDLKEPSWELNGYEGTTKFRVVLTKVHFTDGKVWNSNPKNPIFIKSY